jgi:recombination protein RecR
MADAIQRLIQRLARLPGIGEKTATRLAFYLVRAPESYVRELATALIDVVERTRTCSVCANFTEAEPCAICADPRRDPALICVVASPADVVAIDRAGEFRGLYHVLHGLLSPLDGIGPDDLQIAALMRRLRPPAPSGPGQVASGRPAPGPGPAASAAAGSATPAGSPVTEVTEVIVATSASVEGEATAMYLARLIKPLGIRVSRIASGIPVGGELEYSDQATIARALAGRSPL